MEGGGEEGGWFGSIPINPRIFNPRSKKKKEKEKEGLCKEEKEIFFSHLPTIQTFKTLQIRKMSFFFCSNTKVHTASESDFLCIKAFLLFFHIENISFVYSKRKKNLPISFSILVSSLPPTKVQTNVAHSQTRSRVWMLEVIMLRFASITQPMLTPQGPHQRLRHQR